MYDLYQITIKLILTIFVVMVIMVASVTLPKIWLANIDLSQLLNPLNFVKHIADTYTKTIPLYQEDGIYQNGKLVAQVSGITVDKAHQKILFKEIYKADTLDREAEFEFQKWRLMLSSDKFSGFDTSQPQKGTTIQEALCEIRGTRRIFISSMRHKHCIHE